MLTTEDRNAMLDFADMRFKGAIDAKTKFNNLNYPSEPAAITWTAPASKLR